MEFLLLVIPKRMCNTVDCFWFLDDHHDDESRNSNPGISIAVSRRIHRGIRHHRSDRLLSPSHVSEGGILVDARDVRGRGGLVVYVVVVVVVVAVAVAVAGPPRRVALHVRAKAGGDRGFRHAADDDPGEGSEEEFGFLLQRAGIQVDTLFGGKSNSES